MTNVTPLIKLTKTELGQIDDLGYIPEHLLDRYLSDKIIVKPDYQNEYAVKSQYEELRKAMKVRSRGKKDDKKKGR